MSRNRNPIETSEWQVADARKNKRYDRERVTVNSGDIETLIAELVEAKRKLEAIREWAGQSAMSHEREMAFFRLLNGPVPVVLDTKEPSRD